MRLAALVLTLLAAACGPDLKYCPGCDPPRISSAPDMAKPGRPPLDLVGLDLAAPADMASPADLASPADMSEPSCRPDLAEPRPDLAKPSCQPDLAEPPCQRPTCDTDHCGHEGHHCNHGSSCPFHQEN